MKIDTKLAEAKWIDYEDDTEVKFKLRPFPMSQGIYVDSDDIIEYTWKKFNYSVIDWKGITNEKDQPLECNDENKKFIFDYVQDLMMWIMVEISKLTSDLSSQKKT